MIASIPKLARITGAMLLTLVFGSACNLDLINIVTPCAIDPQCDDGIFCNGAEKCVEGLCVAGVDRCVDPSLPVCDEGRMVCVQCDSDAACDDVFFCNGVESCVDGVCVSSGIPCSDLRPVCDENRRECVQCVDDSQCDDSLFCNGAETCAEGSCQSNPSFCDRFLDECIYDVCNEETDQCLVPCTSDEDCEPSPCMITRCSSCRCFSSPAICDAGMICNESLDACVLDEMGVCVPDCDDPVDECLFLPDSTYDEVLLAWNRFPMCTEPSGESSWHVGGICSDGTLFVDTFDILHHLVQFYNPVTFEFSSAVFQSDAIEPVCLGLSYWPVYFRCEDATVKTVVCGSTYEVGDSIELPGDERATFFP